jgi:hypothetical protein
MIKVFSKDRKTNIVDDNNILVGYDDSQCCCEDCRHEFLDRLPKGESYYDLSSSQIDLNLYRFDEKCRTLDPELTGLDSGGSVAFKLVAEGQPDMYLVLFNAHNGYYAHGFKFCKGETVIYEDSL